MKFMSHSNQIFQRGQRTVDYSKPYKMINEFREWMKGLHTLSCHYIFLWCFQLMKVKWLQIKRGAEGSFFSDMHKKLMKTQHVHQENKKQGQPRLSNGIFPAPVIKCITEKEDGTSMTEHETMYEQPRGVWHHCDLLRECKVQTAQSGTEVRSGAAVVDPMVHHWGDAGGTVGIIEATCGLVRKRDSCFESDEK